MAFARIETAVLNHKKFGPLVRANGGLQALGLWMLMLVYSADQLADGRVPKAWLVARLGKRVVQRSGERLCAARLAEDLGDDYLVHDYLDWNPSSTQIKADRQAARDRMKRRRGSPEHTPNVQANDAHLRQMFRRTATTVRQQDVDVDVDVDLPPRERLRLFGRTASQTMRGGFPFFDWPSPEVQAAYARGETHWLPGRCPFEAFHADCPDAAWRGLCVTSDYARAHPGAFPATSTGEPSQCPAHREMRPAW